jgi:hypothetical protein
MLGNLARIASAVIFLTAAGFLGIIVWSSLCSLNHEVVVQSEAIAENY